MYIFLTVCLPTQFNSSHYKSNILVLFSFFEAWSYMNAVLGTLSWRARKDVLQVIASPLLWSSFSVNATFRFNPTLDFF